MSVAIDTDVPAPQRPTDYSGRSIGPLRLARAMTINIVAGTCIMMALAVLWPNAAITIVFLQEQLGASKTLIGLNFTLVVAATAAALPGAWLFSRIQKRRVTWVLLTVIARMCMFGPAIVAVLSSHEEWHGILVWVVMLSLFLVQAGGVFTSPGWWSWMADLIPESIWGSFFGRRYRWMLLGQSLLAIAAGKLLDFAQSPPTLRLMFCGIFAVAALLAVLDPALFTFVPEPVRPRPSQRSLAALAREYLEPIRDRGFRMLLIGAGGYNFFYNLPFVFLVLFLRGEEHNGAWIGGKASLGLLSLVTVVFAVATALSANQWGRLADRIGHKTVWILSSLGYFVHISFFFINEHNYQWLALVNAALFGLTFAGQPVAVQNMALSMAPAKRREFYTSLYLSVTALAAALGPLLGGWLSDQFRVLPGVKLPSGQPPCFIHLLLIVAFVGMLLMVPLMVRVPDPKGTAVRPWFGRLISGDLLRVAWNISVLGTSTRVPRRVRALRRISPRDGNLMLPEIVSALDDPDSAIRREALLALGRLGTGEALDLLRWYLYDPDAATRAQSVVALGHARVPDRTSLLKRALHDPDSRVRRAAVEALGRSGERGAALELRTLLTDERDGEVLASVAVALSRLKEFGAVREMLDLALFSENSTVRAQMLVALADLLGQTGDFHRLWRQDRQWRGSSFARLTGKLRRQARVLRRTDVAAGTESRADRRQSLVALNERIEDLLERVQAEDWREALHSLRQVLFQYLVLRYGYHGDEEHALEFLSAVAPNQAQRYWLVTYLQHTADKSISSEAPWDGLTLLAIYVLVHGQAPEEPANT